LLRLTYSVQADRHAQTFVDKSVSHPELYAHMPLGPFSSASDFTEFLDKLAQWYAGCITFAIIDRTKPPSAEDDEGALAGMVSYIRTSTTHLSTEIGGVLILPEYHRTHVTTNANGLMLQYALDLPEDGGLGLRRVQWQTSTMNESSIRVAERLGFRREAVLRWHMIFRNGVKNQKVGNGRPLPPGSEDGDLGRDTVLLSLCWDDWGNGGRERVVEAMERRQ
jgi:RimJ/RimL family protein N-acetyltransferase